MNSPFAAIPMQTVGPIKITGPDFHGDVKVPLATYETPLWPSTDRGAHVTREAGGIRTIVISDNMTRSILLEAPDAITAYEISQQLDHCDEAWQTAVSKSSSYAQYQSHHIQQVGNLLYIRLSIKPGDAAGHNMTTKAADSVIDWLLSTYPTLAYVSISGNTCTDKKVSAINSILGRGKKVVAETLIPADLCEKILHCTPQAIVNLNIKKNLLGSIISGGVASANAHYANVLLAFYLATGQDAANIVEGSQGVTHTEIKDGHLYFSVTLPNIIVGTVGNGKEFDFVQKNLLDLGCLPAKSINNRSVQITGESARRLAAIAGATVLCSELSLLASQTKRGALTRSHMLLERRQKNKNKVLLND